MLDTARQLEEMLRRHPDAAVADGDAQRPCLYRRNEIIVGAPDVGHVDSAARRWVDRREDLDHLGVARYRLREHASALSLAYDLAGDVPHRRRAVAPNHLLRAQRANPGEALRMSPGATPLSPRPGRDDGVAGHGGPVGPPKPVRGQPAWPVAPAGERPRLRVGLLDTGISEHPWWAAHPWFRQTDEDDHERLGAGQDGHGHELSPADGHGTFVAGQIIREIPDATLVVERVLGRDGVCDELELVAHLDRLWHRTAGAGRPLDLINISFGGYSYDDRPSPHLLRALTRFGQQTVIVGCAGNHAGDRPFWPAALKQVVAVGSIDPVTRDRSAFSNFGWWVDACAAGEEVVSTFPVRDRPVRFWGRSSNAVQPDSGYATWTGTSFAAPAVTAAIGAAAATEQISARAAADRLLDWSRHAVIPDLGVCFPGGAA